VQLALTDSLTHLRSLALPLFLSGGCDWCVFCILFLRPGRDRRPHFTSLRCWNASSSDVAVAGSSVPQLFSTIVLTVRIQVQNKIIQQHKKTSEKFVFFCVLFKCQKSENLALPQFRDHCAFVKIARKLRFIHGCYLIKNEIHI